MSTTTNKFGSVGTDSTVATVVTFAKPPYQIILGIQGTSGAARISKTSSPNVPLSPDLNLDDVCAVNQQIVLTSNGPGGISQLQIYSNASESGLTYVIDTAKQNPGV